MFQSAAFDVAIGLALMYLVLSLFCTAVNEYIASRLKLRSSSLATALKQLLDNDTVRQAFYKNGLIASTITAMKKATKLRSAAQAAMAPPSTIPDAQDHPSYIAADTFVLALIGSLDAAPASNATVPGLPEIAAAVKNLPEGKLKDSLEASLTEAQGDFDTFRKSVATWFDNSMDRLSGSYKRNLKFISILVGCVVAVVMNADSLAVGRALWSDSSLRAQVVQGAETVVKTQPATPSGSTSDELVKAFAKTEQDLRPLPIGWSKCAVAVQSTAPTIKTEQKETLRFVSSCIPRESAFNWLFVPFKLFGLFATGLALSIGAPFWFDTLSKFVNIRSAGAKPERKDK